MDNIEILKQILLSENVVDSIKENENIIFGIIPLLKYEKDFNQKNKKYPLDLWNHTIKAIGASNHDFEMRLVLLLHDIGKPFTYQEEKNERKFRGHALKSRQISKSILENLGYRGEKLQELLFLIGYHSTKINPQDINSVNINIYRKLLSIQLCNASAYEVTYATKKVLELAKTHDEMYKELKNKNNMIKKLIKK